MTVLVRRATTADLDTLVNLRSEFLAESRSLPVDQLPVGFSDATRAFFSRHHRARTIRSWIAEEQGEVVGIVSLLILDMPPHPLDDRSSEGYVVNMYVVPLRRRQGVARRLLAAVLEAGVELRLRKLMLYSTEAGRTLYKHAGFAGHSGFMDLRLPGATSDQ